MSSGRVRTRKAERGLPSQPPGAHQGPETLTKQTTGAESGRSDTLGGRPGGWKPCRVLSRLPPEATAGTGPTQPGSPSPGLQPCPLLYCLRDREWTRRGCRAAGPAEPVRSPQGARPLGSSAFTESTEHLHSGSRPVLAPESSPHRPGPKPGPWAPISQV